jgi:hypothetical protein
MRGDGEGAVDGRGAVAETPEDRGERRTLVEAVSAASERTRPVPGSRPERIDARRRGDSGPRSRGRRRAPGASVEVRRRIPRRAVAPRVRASYRA